MEFIIIIFIVFLIAIIYAIISGMGLRTKITNNPDIICHTIVSYIGGHESFTGTINNGVLTIEKDRLVFYDSKFERMLFGVEANTIKNIIYDTAEKITLTRLVTLGIGAFAFKKKEYYLLITYTSGKGIENQMVFNAGTIKNQKFANEVNRVRNL